MADGLDEIRKRRAAVAEQAWGANGPRLGLLAVDKPTWMDVDRLLEVIDRQWQPIETAPLNQSVLIWIPNPVAEHYGAPVFRGLLKESVGAKIWMVTGLHFGSDVLLDEYQPTHWMPLPNPPKVSKP